MDPPRRPENTDASARTPRDGVPEERLELLGSLVQREGRAILSVFGSNLILALGGLVSGFILARALHPSGRGLLGSIQALPSVLAAFVMLGMQESVLYLGINNPERRRTYLKLALAMSGAVATLTFTLFAILPWGIAHRSWAHTAYFAVVIITPLMYLPHQVLQASHRFGTWSALKALPSMMWILVALFVAVIPSTRSGTFVAMAYLCALAAIVPVFLIVGVRSAPRGPRPTREDARMLLRYGVPVMLTAAPMAINLRLDLVVVAGRFDLTRTGYYVAALAWAGLLTPIFGTFTVVAMPIIARRRLEHRTDHGGLFLVLATTVVIVVTAVAVPVTNFVFPRVFGSSFRPATRLASLALAVGAVQGAKDVAASSLRGRGQVGAPLIAESISLFVTLGTLWVFLNHFGLAGGQWSSLLAYGVSWLILVWFIAHPDRGLKGLPVTAVTDVA